MGNVRFFLVWLCAIAACGAYADTIPTLTADYVYVGWNTGSDRVDISGPGFQFSGANATSEDVSYRYPCSDNSGCQAPGPNLFIGFGPGTSPVDLDGYVVVNGAKVGAVLELRGQLQYYTPTVTWPATQDTPGYMPAFPALLVTSGQVCSPYVQGYDNNYCPPNPVYIANISINLPGMVGIYHPGPFLEQMQFTATPEPASLLLVGGGLVLLAARGRRRGVGRRQDRLPHIQKRRRWTRASLRSS